MGLLIISIIGIVIGIVCILLPNWCNARWSKAHDYAKKRKYDRLAMFFGITGAILLVIFITTLLISTISIISHKCEDDLEYATYVDKYNNYSDLINNYNELKLKDVTASDSYLQLREGIIKYNTKIREVSKWCKTWIFRGMYNERLAELPIIPLA